MSQLKTLLFIILIGMVSATFAQTWGHTAHVTSLGGGEISGGSFTTTVVAGDPSASEEIAVGGNKAMYPGFIPGSTIVLSFGLKKDSSVLAVFYQSLDGDNWVENSGWLESSDVSEWFGVEVSSSTQRVIGIDLPENNLQNRVPELVKNLEMLETMNVSDNEIRRFPNISTMPALSSLDISGNRLAFRDIIPNLALDAAIVYAPQSRYGLTENDTVQAGENFEVSVDMPGEGLQYQWNFASIIPGEPFNNDVASIADANDRTYLIDSIDYDKQGTYRVDITHPQVPDLTISSRNRNIWASTDLFGTVFEGSEDDTPLEAGEVFIYRVTEPPYYLEDSAEVAASGEYIFDDLVLGDFLILVKPNRDEYPLSEDPGSFNIIQTYYEQAEFDTAATPVEVRDKVEDVNVRMISYTVETRSETGADFEGLVESDFEDEGSVDEEDERINSRKKVKRAGCSMRRFVRRGRTDQDGEYELYAYVESDDEGRFNFNDVEEGTYRLNIEYPGIPMDDESDIEFVVGGDKENQQFDLQVTVTEEGVSVDAKEVLYTIKPYLKRVRVYPNPAADYMEADYLVYRRINDLQLRLIDSQGRELAARDVNHQMGRHSARLDLTGIRSGMYFLEFSDDSRTFRHQVKVGKE